MKRVILIILSLAILNIPALDKAKAITDNTDASCTNVDQSGYKEVGLEAPDEQTFVPTYDRLTKIDIIVGGHLWGTDNINFTLYNAIGTVVGTGSITPTINGGPTTRTWTPASPISVRKNVTYRFRVENPNTADFVWYATGDNSCYSSGNARQQNADKNFDFGFTTYGYDSATATPQSTSTQAPEATDQESNQVVSTDSNNDTASSEDSISNISLNTGSSTGTGEAPSGNVSSSIKEPANLAIEQITVSDKPVLKLTWRASTTTAITGYKIFRSDKEKTGYKNTAKLDKKILEYKDAEVEVGKTYYYQVRTYKDTSESKSSNTVSKAVTAIASVSATVVASIMPLISTSALPPEPKSSWPIWILLIVLVFIITGIILYKKKKWPFNKLIINQIGGSVAEETKKGSLWVWVAIVVLVLVIGGLALWYFTKDNSNTGTEKKTTQATVTIPDGWKGFTSNKYGLSLSYPSDYTVAESAVGTLKFSKDGKEMIDMYVYAANGDEAGMMTSQEALYTDDTKGYMIMDAVVQGTVGGVASKTVNGKFGKNAGVSQTHEGVTGSTTFFTDRDRLYVFNSYDDGDATAQKNFTDFLATISL